jgi:hypothetical protein
MEKQSKLRLIVKGYAQLAMVSEELMHQLSRHVLVAKDAV